MAWVAIGDDASIRVTAQSSIAQLQSRNRTSDHNIIDLTTPEKSPKRPSGSSSRSSGSDSKAPKPVPVDETTYLHKGPTGPFKPASRCRVSQSSVDKKGSGLRATTKIRPGEIIIVERPFLVVDYPPPQVQIDKQYLNLSGIERLMFHSFKSKSPSDINSKLSDIIVNNVIPLGIGMGTDGKEVMEGEPTRSGMFQYICRVNHSCVPNARWTWREQEQRMELKAILPIAPNQEITASYLDDHTELFNERQKILYQYWGFRCRCEQCLLPKSLQLASDVHLRRYRLIRDRYIGNDNAENWQVFGFRDCWSKIKQAICLLGKEERWTEIADCWESLFHVAVGWGERSEAIEAGRSWAAELAKTGDHMSDTERQCIEKPEDLEDWCSLIGPEEIEIAPEAESSGDEDFESHWRSSKRRRVHRTRSTDQRAESSGSSSSDSSSYYTADE